MDQLGDDVVAVVFFAGVVDWENIRMLQAAHPLGLIEEHLAGYFGFVLVFFVLNVVDLNGNIAAVGGIVRQINPPATALPEIPDDLVLAYTLGNVGRGETRQCRFGSSLDHIKLSVSISQTKDRPLQMRLPRCRPA